MKKKSHANAPDKCNFSVAMTKVLAAELKEMAKEQGRNRNAQINWLLRNEIERWKAERSAPLTKPALPPKHLRPGYVPPEADGKTA